MSAIFKIISFTRKFGLWYIFMGIFVIAISLLSLVVPLFSKELVDIIVAQIKSSQASDYRRIIIILLFIISTDIFISILTAISQWIGDMLAVRLQTYLSTSFYKHILGLSIGFYDNEITGRIVNKMYRGITSITDFIQSMLNNFLPFFLTAFVTIILLARYSLIIALLLAILFPIYILISHGSTLAWQKHEQKKNAINDFSQGRVFESISGIRVVKAFAAEIHELATFLKSRRQIEGITITQTKGWHIYDFARRLALNIILFAIFSYIVYWTYAGRFTIGEMTLLLALVAQARFPLFAMSFILGQIQQAESGSRDFFGLLATSSLIKDKETSIGLKMEKLHHPLVEFKKVNFKYDTREILKEISFVVGRKEKLALVGESGQGKSTIVNLLLRFYEPQKGSIRINNQDISSVTQNSLHQNIAVVFQESLLFSGTIMENISYGKPGASISEVEAAAKAAHAAEFIEELPQKYESLIGERGVKLSGGQKQRIAIARAILKNAPIIILDEATSSLDSRAEVLVQRGLDNLLHNRTSIIIAHRLSTIANADHILVISKGKVAQYGSPKELLADKRGMYARLISLQQELLKAPSDEREEKLKAFDLVG